MDERVVAQVTSAVCYDSTAWRRIREVGRFVSRPDPRKVDKRCSELGRVLGAALAKLVSVQLDAAVSLAQTQTLESRA